MCQRKRSWLIRCPGACQWSPSSESDTACIGWSFHHLGKTERPSWCTNQERVSVAIEERVSQTVIKMVRDFAHHHRQTLIRSVLRWKNDLPSFLVSSDECTSSLVHWCRSRNCSQHTPGVFSGANLWELKLEALVNLRSFASAVTLMRRESTGAAVERTTIAIAAAIGCLCCYPSGNLIFSS